MSITESARGRAAALSALITVVSVCAGDAIARSFPFGPRTRAVNDLGNQFVPYHAHLWDVLRGRADGGVLINWQSGYGTSFLPDIGTYVSSPFALLVALFPRDETDLAVYVITVLKMAAAAAAMTVLLLVLREGGSRWWAAGLLGSSYALCGWAVTEAVYNPMWMDGLVAFPLLCLVGEWARTGHHRVLGPVIVAVAWAANFYTAYMATLGAGLVLLLRLLTDGASTSVRERLGVLLRAACTTLLGIGLAAPVLAVVFLGSTHAYPGWRREFAPAGWADVFARALPATYGFFTPAVFLGTGTLVLAGTLLFNRTAPRRERRAWTLLVVAVAVSMQWGPTHLVWHVFATPNGSPYRQTFVLAGVLVIAAWISLSYGWPGPQALLGGTGVVALLALGAATSPRITAWTYPLAVAGVAATVGGVLLAMRADVAAPDNLSAPPAFEERGLGRSPSFGKGRVGESPAGSPTPRAGARRALVLSAALLLIGAQIAQATVTTAYADRQRLAKLDDYAPWGDRQQTQADAVADVDGWPAYRTEPGREQTTANDPLTVGGQGAAYYSSHTPDVLTRTLAALGAGWTSNGRAVQSLDNPVTDALFSVGARVHMPRDPHHSWSRPDGRKVRVTRAAVPQLVTVRPPGPEPRFGASPFRNQEKLLGARVYTLPRTAVRTELRTELQAELRAATLTAACPARSEVFLWAPGFSGTAKLGGSHGPGGTESELRGSMPARRAAMQPLGTVPADGRVSIALKGAGAGAAVGKLPRQSVGCLDRDRLATAVDRLRSTGATSVRVTDSGVRATLPPGASGTAVFAMPRIAGWSCRAAGAKARPAASHLGLVAVDLPGRDSRTTTVTCDFSPPGLRIGTLAGGLSLLVLVAAGILPRLLPRLPSRRRRSHTKTSPEDHRLVARTA
ncbi:YfhO family protein [Streptomyces sp. ISL-96]|uniref:YfhO family protein n=1 Tax=Streptomyces sp. ISL-96 TaxID=2819191 RepID=UPI001BE9E64B|nr:YfhO family protein [Streptomyces sp. ISL-96]MBT2491829.1 YfhO family protein [Streptomyces sp. ISL-96]